jgi:hypothetical protein
MPDKLITAKELRNRAEALLKERKMPGLDEVLQAIGDTRKEFSPRILQARTAVPTFPEQQLQVPKAAPATTPLEAGLAAFKKTTPQSQSAEADQS